MNFFSLIETLNNIYKKLYCKKLKCLKKRVLCLN